MIWHYITSTVDLFEKHDKLAGWAQAIMAAVAILAVFYAARIPVKAEEARQAADRKLKAAAIALLILPDILTLIGTVERALDSPIGEHRISPPPHVLRFLDQLYLLDSTGHLILQAVGILSGVRHQTDVVILKGYPNQTTAGEFWETNVSSLTLALDGLKQAVEPLTNISNASA